MNREKRKKRESFWVTVKVPERVKVRFYTRRKKKNTEKKILKINSFCI